MADPTPRVTLEPVDGNNRSVVEALAVRDWQRAYLTTPDLAAFLADDDAHPSFSSHVVKEGDEVVGFVSYGHISGRPQEAWIPLIVIDARSQGRGLGRATMVAVIDALRVDARGFATIGLSCRPENAMAMGLYESLGFVLTGAVDEKGEVEMRLDLR